MLKALQLLLLFTAFSAQSAGAAVPLYIFPTVGSDEIRKIVRDTKYNYLYIVSWQHYNDTKLTIDRISPGTQSWPGKTKRIVDKTNPLYSPYSFYTPPKDSDAELYAIGKRLYLKAKKNSNSAGTELLSLAINGTDPQWLGDLCPGYSGVDIKDTASYYGFAYFLIDACDALSDRILIETKGTLGTTRRIGRFSANTKLIGTAQGVITVEAVDNRSTVTIKRIVSGSPKPLRYRATVKTGAGANGIDGVFNAGNYLLVPEYVFRGIQSPVYYNLLRVNVKSNGSSKFVNLLRRFKDIYSRPKIASHPEGKRKGKYTYLGKSTSDESGRILQLWVTDGTSRGTKLVRASSERGIEFNSSRIQEGKYGLNGVFYMMAQHWKYGEELHRITPESIKTLWDLYPGYNSNSGIKGFGVPFENRICLNYSGFSAPRQDKGVYISNGAHKVWKKDDHHDVEKYFFSDIGQGSCWYKGYDQGSILQIYLGKK